MTLATLDELGIEPNDDGVLDGLQFGGRERSIQEWRDRKKEEEYRKLFESLSKRNHARKVRQATPEKAREALARYKARNGDKIRQMAKARNRAAYEADPTINTCIECDKTWVVPYEHRPRKSKFCCRKCRNRHHGRSRSKRKNRGLVNTALLDLAATFLIRNPWSSCAAIAAGASVKQSSLAVRLKSWVEAGIVERRGSPRAYEYRLLDYTPAPCKLPKLVAAPSRRLSSVLAWLAGNPWSTSREIADGLGADKRSLDTALTAWTRQGDVVRRGTTRRFQYAALGSE